MAVKITRLMAFVLTLVMALSASTICLAAMQGDVDQAVAILQRFQEIPEKSIPPAVLKQAKGLAILTITKAGFIVSGRGGMGVVVARLGKGWSGPSAIGTGGAGFGFQIGAQVSEIVVVLNTPDAVKAFSQGGNFSLGADLSVAAGPVGRDVSADVLPMAAIYSYSRSQGLFAGVSLEGTVIVTRDDANAQFYGRKVTPAQILSGQAKPPKGAAGLVKALSKY
jgi:SH3 domain-containing YSC84-like protein 1